MTPTTAGTDVIFEPAAYTDGPPHELFSWLRANDPVHRAVTPDGTACWAVTRHADVVDVSRRTEVFSAAESGVVLHDRQDPDINPDPTDERSASIEMALYAMAFAADRRRMAEQPADLTTVILATEVDGAPMTDPDFGAFFVQLVTAGNDTTKTMLSSGLAAARPPRSAGRAARRPVAIPGAVEEILRWANPLHYFRRTATADTELGGAIAAGDKVAMMYTSANRDEDVFADPQRFDITRDPNPHLSFGIAEHFCLGVHLARLEGRVFFEELLARLRFDDSRGRRARTLWRDVRDRHLRPRPRSCELRDRSRRGARCRRLGGVQDPRGRARHRRARRRCGPGHLPARPEGHRPRRGREEGHARRRDVGRAPHRLCGRGISPFGQRTRHRTFVDESAELWDRVHVSGGRRGMEVVVEPTTFAEVLDAVFCDLTGSAS
jgi:cytochrome P450